MSKKRKYTFIDLADDDFVKKNSNFSSVNQNTRTFENNEIKLNLNANEQNENKEKKIENNNSNNNLSKDNIENKNSFISQQETNSDNKLIKKKNDEIIQKNTEKKIYEVNYDDILSDELPNKKEIVESFFEKKDPIKELFSSKEENNNQNLIDKKSVINNQINENISHKNLKPRSTIKTYNEALKKQEINKSENYFEEDKIKQFLNVKEKLEVKTNIYLKSSIVIKLKELEERTNESRSSIINKLIEMALKNIE